MKKASVLLCLSFLFMMFSMQPAWADDNRTMPTGKVRSLTYSEEGAYMPEKVLFKIERNAKTGIYTLSGYIRNELVYKKIGADVLQQVRDIIEKEKIYLDAGVTSSASDESRETLGGSPAWSLHCVFDGGTLHCESSDRQVPEGCLVLKRFLEYQLIEVWEKKHFN